MLLQRILLLSYDKASKRIHLQHYSVSAQPGGVSKGVKALISQRAVPDVSHVQDVSEFLSKSGYGSVGLLPLPLPLPRPRPRPLPLLLLLPFPLPLPLLLSPSPSVPVCVPSA